MAAYLQLSCACLLIGPTLSACLQDPREDKKLWGTETDGDTQLDPERLAQALEKVRKAVESQLEHDERCGRASSCCS